MNHGSTPLNIPNPPEGRRLITYWLMLGSGHFMVDLVAGMFPPIVPLLMRRFDASLFVITLLLTIFGVASNATQVAFGKMVDHYPRAKRLLLLAPVLVCAPVFLAFTSWIGVLVALFVLGGLALAMYHPLALHEVQLLSRLPRGMAVSIFIAGGYVGYAAGAFAGAQIGEKLGLGWFWLPVIPGVLISIGLLVTSKGVGGIDGGAPSPEEQSRASGYSFRLVWIAAVFVSIVSTVLMSLIPTYAEIKTGSLVPGGTALMGYTLFGAAGAAVFGTVSDRVPRGYVCGAALASSVVCLEVFFLRANAPLIWFSMAGLGVGASTPLLITMSHESKGRASSLRNGLMLGGCWVVGSLIMPIFGKAGDMWGLQNALPWATVLLPVPAIMALLLEMSERRKTTKLETRSSKLETN